MRLRYPRRVYTATQIGGRTFRYNEPLTIVALNFLAASYLTVVAMMKPENRLGHA